MTFKYDPDRIRIFVGCSGGGEDAESMAVLEHTAKKHSSLPVDIYWMQATYDQTSPWHGWQMETWATPFSGFRWSIPEVCGYEGKAIYMDSDMIIMRDLAELWNTPFEKGKAIQAKGGSEGWRYCTALFNCAAWRFIQPIPLERMKKISASHQRMMQYMIQHQQIVQQYDKNWNCIDGEHYLSLEDEDIGIIHYSSMNHQPHLKYAIPRLEKMGMRHWFDGEVQVHWRRDLINLFEKELDEAIQNGYTVESYIPGSNARYTEYNKESQANYKNMHQWVQQ